MTSKSTTTTPLVLRAETAADLMTKNPLSISQDATVPEAAAFLVDNEISAAPVIDTAGRAVGVLSHTDLTRLQGQPNESLTHGPDFYRVADLFWPPAYRNLLHAKNAEHIHVKELMTPTINSVLPDYTVVEVVAKLVALKV